MHFLIRETLSFNLIYVAACYLVGTGMCHNMVGLLQHYKSCPGCDFLASQICLFTLFAKIKFLRKFQDLQYCISGYGNTCIGTQRLVLSKTLLHNMHNLLYNLREQSRKWGRKKTTTNSNNSSVQTHPLFGYST